MKNFRKRRGDAGFTMIELMIVVLVVGVLAAIAVPLYAKYIKNARITEATGKIGEILTACKSYAQTNTDPTTDHPQWPTAGGGTIDLTSTDNFQYSIPSGGGDATTTPFTITATGINRMAGIVVAVTDLSINQNAGPPVISGPNW